MIEFLAEYARVIVFCFGGITAAGYAWCHKRADGGELHREISNLLLVWLAGTSLPVSAFLIPRMAVVFERFSGQLFIYGTVSLFVIANSLWQRWPQGRDDD